MILQGRSPKVGHVARTHRVNSDWLIERFKLDLAISIRYVHTKSNFQTLSPNVLHIGSL